MLDTEAAGESSTVGILDRQFAQLMKDFQASQDRVDSKLAKFNTKFDRAKKMPQ